MRFLRLRRFLRRRFAFLSAWCVLATLVTALAFTPKPSKPTVKVLDNQFHILSARAFKGKTTLYVPDGNQLEGRIRDHLQRWGAPVGVLPRSTGRGPDSRAFIVYYDYPLPAEPSAHLEAELVDDEGRVFRLHCPAGGQGPPRRYWSLWTLDSLPSDARNCVLRLKTQTNDAPVAEIRFGQE